MAGRFQFTSDGTPAADGAVSAMAAVADQDYEVMKAVFGLGDPPHLPFVVHAESARIGAIHRTMDGTEIWTQTMWAPWWLMCEVEEVFMALSGRMIHNDALEAHSRVFAEAVRPWVFDPATGMIAPSSGDTDGWWLHGINPVDYFNSTGGDGTIGTHLGCTCMALYWLRSLGYSWEAITRNFGLSIGILYTNLTGKTGTQGFAEFVAACHGIENWNHDIEGVVMYGPNPFPQQPALPNGGQPVGDFYPVKPVRLLDTRNYPPPTPPHQPLGPGGTRSLTIGGVAPVPAGATAAAVNITVTGGTADSFLTLFPATPGAPVPPVSNLNWKAGQTLANFAIVPLDPGSGAIGIYNLAGNVDVLVDLAGYFS